ncbi:hypothetical protein, partial [Pseudomonas rossensis]|uniref:hypothetical protein n=1 Tax=Pseudomonas rossensis TaxID=2305471 RepID=UPI0032618654
HFFDFGVGAHHDGLAPERNREHSIGHQVSAWNVGFMERLRLIKDWQILHSNADVKTVPAFLHRLDSKRTLAKGGNR